MRGAHQIGFRAGRVRFIGSRWQGLRFPSPFPSLPSRPTSPSSCYLSPTSRPPPCPSHRRLFLHAGADQRVPAPDEPASPCPGPERRKGASARASPALRIAFSAACSPAGGGRRTAAPPTPSPRVLKGWTPLPFQNRRRLRWEPCSTGRRLEASQSWLCRAYVIRGGGRSWVQAPLVRRRRRRRRGCLRRHRIGGTICTGRAATAPAGPRAALAPSGAVVGLLRRLLPTGRWRVRPLLP